MKKRSITILYNSPVILTFALLSLLALGLGKLTDGWTTQNLFCVYRSSLTDWLTYPRFFLHVLGHPDFAAYCSNIVMLLVVGAYTLLRPELGQRTELRHAGPRHTVGA